MKVAILKYAFFSEINFVRLKRGIFRAFRRAYLSRGDPLFLGEGFVEAEADVSECSARSLD